MSAHAHAHVLVRAAPVRIGVLTNPNARRNRARAEGGAGSRQAELQSIVGERGVVCETATLEALRPAVERLLDRGVRYLVADGGDGTLHWLLNEVGRALGGRLDEAPLLVPGCGGTINFVARKAGIRGPLGRILGALVEAERRGTPLDAIDVETLALVGEVAGRGGEHAGGVHGGGVHGGGVHGGGAAGAAFARLGFCAALGGVGQRFFDRYYQDPSPGPWTIVKVIAKALASMASNLPLARRLAPRALVDYVRELTDPARARVWIDGERLPGERFRAIDLGAIGVNLGGVVRLFPLARPGRLHALTGDPSLMGIALCLPRLVLGKRLRHGLDDRAAREVEVEAVGGAPLRPVVDGERLPPLARVRAISGPTLRVPRL